MAVNWDTINVGKMDLNHSEGFFNTHLDHERLEVLIEGKLQISDDKPTKPKVAGKQKSNKENKGAKDKVQKTIEENVEMTVKSMTKITHGMTLRSYNRQTIVTTSNNGGQSRLLNYATVYEKHKQELVEKKKIEEEKQLPKPFKARPVPKFIQAKGVTKDLVKEGNENKAPVSKKPLWAPKQVAPKSKPPIARVGPYQKTVDTLDTGTTDLIKPKPVKSNFKVPPGKTNPIPKGRSSSENPSDTKKFAAKIPKYLYKEPFKVKLTGKREVTEVKPFKLSSDTRVDSRSKSDAERRKLLEEKNKQMMEAKEKKELEELKVMRKKREFKASVNPFGTKLVVKKTNNIESTNENQKNEEA